MHTPPDQEEVVAVARSIGFHLTEEDAPLYQREVAAQLAAMDQFLQARMPERTLPVTYAAREPGYRPGADEDPLNAWMWRCEIAGADDGPLAGRKVSFKDHVAVAGIPMTIGAHALEGFVPDFDATIVTRSLAAGATVTGKNVMNGLTGGFGFGGGIGDYGRTKNPHDHDHVPGGSSGGSAAAVAAGEVDISFGGDQGGSIRIPAAWSGTVGLKPTFGLVSHFGLGFGSDQSIDFTGPMSRTMEDAAAALDAVAGHDGLDPRQGREIPDGYDSLATLHDGVSGLRVAVLDEAFIDSEPGVHDGVMAAVEVLGEAGAVISKVSIPEHLVAPAVQAAFGPEGSKAVFDTGFYGLFAKSYYPENLLAAVNRVWQEQLDVINPRTKLSYITAEMSKRRFHGRVYAKAQNVRAAITAAYDAVLAEVDVLVMPTCITTAPRYDAPTSWAAALEENLSMGRGADRHPWTANTQPFNLTGHPALAVPCGKSDGLPVSMQLVGRPLDDALLLRAGYAYQQSVDWTEVIGLGR
ncbi:amidase family protein [Actinomarinicola tropica]|uniref:Amidase n=1 Tax=Actinomarinicola tropica TaxID=2789776 RepID=A0A5Q2RK90_9ACTN|nr:amidase family protein [Actinomarinicola tropica]QGG94991.1 amidase [Actinomarinicola tropica]